MEARPKRLPPEPDDAASPSPDSLPTEILEKIVSCLPVRDAVRTSAVSRAWHHLWESAPGLALEWRYGAADPAAADAVLARYSRAVRSFRFDFGRLPDASFSHADNWVSLLAGKGVQALELRFSQGSGVEPYCLGASIFSCRELTRLHLFGCDIPAAPPGSAGFPNLTRLHLDGVGFPDDGVRGLEALIAGSPLLEALSLDLLRVIEEDEEEYELKEWVIQAPNLRELNIISVYGWQIKDMPFIEEVKIRSFGYTFYWDFVKLLTGLARVSKLELSMPICCDNVQEFEVGVDLLNAEWTDSLFANLKTVTMELATCQSNEMHFIQFVLSKARHLQEFHVRVYDECSRSNEELVVEITKYRRTSPEAKVFFSRMDFV